ncbi:MAG: UpxY family transcription antiterminator [Bacteroidota bacterium]|nr:UpxY family transcription antiterminator [Bacteroidota bacterium]
MSKWFVVYIASRQEKKVARTLTQMGVEFYLPLVKKLRQWSDRKKWVEFPMFNGYLFVRPMENQQEKILQVQGIVSYLTFHRKRAQVTEKEIDTIRQIEQSGYVAEHFLEEKDFKLGEKVTITGGPLKGQQGILLQKKEHHIFVVLFESFQQCLRVNLPMSVLNKSTK